MESPLSVIDAIVIVFTVLSAILAMARGITREILGIASITGALIISLYVAESFAPILASLVNLQPIADKFSADKMVLATWLSGGASFIIMWIIFTVITSKISSYVSDSSVSGIDSALGFIYGAVRGLLLIGIVYTMYTHLISPEKQFESVKSSQTKPILDETSDIIKNIADLLLPERIAQGFSKRPEAVYDNSATDGSSAGSKSNNPAPAVTPEALIKQLQ